MQTMISAYMLLVGFAGDGAHIQGVYASAGACVEAMQIAYVDHDVELEMLHCVETIIHPDALPAIPVEG